MKKEYNEFAPEPDEKSEGELELIWLKQRAGNFTGSKIKDLMGVGRAAAKMTWGDPEKNFHFSEPAIKYIYQTAQERITGFLSQNVSSKNFDHGHENEPKVIAELQAQRDCLSGVDEPGFLLSDDVDHLGATPDGSIIHSEFGFCGLEVKSTVSWDGFYMRTQNPFDSKHNDFWQWQTELHVMKAKILLFAVAYPMEYKNFEVYKIEASEIHINALIERVKIANLAIRIFREGNKEIYMRDAISKAVQICRDRLK